MQIQPDKPCSECGGTTWNHIATTKKDGHEGERNATEKQILVCESCDAEARRFEDGQSGYVRFTGALRGQV